MIKTNPTNVTVAFKHGLDIFLMTTTSVNEAVNQHLEKQEGSTHYNVNSSMHVSRHNPNTTS